MVRFFYINNKSKTDDQFLFCVIVRLTKPCPPLVCVITTMNMTISDEEFYCYEIKKCANEDTGPSRGVGGRGRLLCSVVSGILRVSGSSRHSLVTSLLQPAKQTRRRWWCSVVPSMAKLALFWKTGR